MQLVDDLPKLRVTHMSTVNIAALLVIAARTSQGQVAQVVGTPMIARQNVFNRHLANGFAAQLQLQVSIADQALPRPDLASSPFGEVPGGVCLQYA